MIDWNRVQQLKDEIGEDDFAEVADMFLEEVEEVIDRLKSDPDPDLYEQDMHFLKSSSLNLGFKSLSRLCGEREHWAATGKQEQVTIPPVVDAYEASKEAFLLKQ